MILTDVDGVLLDWFSGFRAWLKTRGIRPVESGDPSSWDMTEWLPNLNVQELIMQFNASPDFANIPAYPDAVLYLRKLHKMGHPIVAITSCSADKVTYDMRWDNLQALFGAIFADLICLPLMTSKVPILLTYPPRADTWWIEDSLHGAQAGVDVGHQTFLIDRRYNIGKDVHRSVTRVEGWEEIYERIKNHRS